MLTSSAGDASGSTVLGGCIVDRYTGQIDQWRQDRPEERLEAWAALLSAYGVRACECGSRNSASSVPGSFRG